MDQVANTNVLLDTGVIVRIVQNAGNDRFMIQIRSTLPLTDGQNLEYYLPPACVPRARAAFDGGMSVDIRGSNESHLMFAELVHTRSLHWTPVETVIHRGTIVDINVQTHLVGVCDQLSLRAKSADRYYNRKISNLSEALTLLAPNPNVTVEIVRVYIPNQPDTFRLRLAETQ